MKTKNIQQLAEKQPLFQSLSYLEQDWSGKKTPNLFLGVGVVTSTQVSTGVPIDILGMIFFAELLRKKLKSEKVFLFLADQHALSNTHLDEEEIKKQAAETFSILSKIIINFDLKHFQLIQCTMLNFVPSIREIFANLPDIENQYLKHEVADVLWLEKFHSMGLKLGWSMNKQSSSEGHDERFFDNKIQEMQAQVSFIHLKPGRTFDEDRPRVSPYISVAGKKRVLLNPNEDVVSKLSEFRQNCPKAVFTAGTRHLSHIARLHDQLFKPLKFMTLQEKLQIILNKAVA